MLSEAFVRRFLGKAITSNNGLHSTALDFLITWEPSVGTVKLDGSFTLPELEAIVWWMKHKST